MKLPISAIVVGFNEGNLLRNCLPPLVACDELLYFDLGSEDDSIAVAQSFGATVIRHERVPSCEWIHAEYASRTRHPWILITDPDEVLAEGLIKEIGGLLDRGALDPEVGAVDAPWQFYFGRRRLRGTTWGGANKRTLLAHRDRFIFRPLIHLGREIRPGYRSVQLEPEASILIHHYWMRDMRQLVEKHRRYLRKEGEARFTRGERTSIAGVVAEPWRAFRYSFFAKRGYRDGLLGVFLSVFWSWYQTAARIELWRFARSAAAKSSQDGRALQK